jgi:hypothetical protein
MKKRRVSKFRCDMSRFHVTLAAGHDFRIKDLEITFFLSGQVKVVQGKSSPTPEEAEARNQPHFLGDNTTRLAYKGDHLPYCLHYSSGIVIFSISSIRNVGQPDGPKPLNPEQTVSLSAHPELVGKSLTHSRTSAKPLDVAARARLHAALPCLVRKASTSVTGD